MSPPQDSPQNLDSETDGPPPPPDDRQPSQREWTLLPWDVTAPIQPDIDGSMIDARSPTIGPARPRSPEMRASQEGPRDIEEDRPELGSSGFHVPPRRQSWAMVNDGLPVTLTTVCWVMAVSVFQHRRRDVTFCLNNAE